LTVLAALLLLLVAGVVWQAIAGAWDSRRYPPPGRLVPVNGHSLHLHFEGEGSPAVVLEAGVAASSLSWRRVQPEVARFTQVCSYDRTGLGWSQPASTPRTASAMVDELHQVLNRSGVPGPYVLAGHSFGALLVCLYAARYPGEVCGLVLVDPMVRSEWWPLRPQQQRMLRHGVRLSRRGAWLARIGVVRFALALVLTRGRTLSRWIAKVSAGRGAVVPDRMAGEIRKLPREVWPMVQAHWCNPKSFDSMARQLEYLPESVAELEHAPPPGDIPIVVLSAATQSEAGLREHQAEARLSLKGVHRVVAGSGHWIQLDAPEAVIEAIREVVSDTRTR